MPVSAVNDFLDTLRQMQLVPAPRLDELVHKAGQFAEARELARHLLDRGLLTPFQVNHLLQDRAQDLLLGQYLLLERLGEGSRGQVFKAQHQRMRRIVALKLIRKELLADADAVQRFYEEIESASQLAHTNVVHAYDAGPIGATHFLAMEYVEGTDLARKVERGGPLPWEQAAAYIGQAALGLQHAFEKGLVHRGITPANLFVTGAREEKDAGKSRKGKKGKCDPSSWGMVKIMDFGQGRLLGSDGNLDQPAPVADPGRGSLDYQAPEKALGSQVDIRADIYSLGCTFHYLLTGQTPHPGGPFVPQEDGSHWQELEPNAPLPENLPESIAAILRCMTAAAPDDRYQTPAEVADALTHAGVDLRLAVTSALPDSKPSLALTDSVHSVAISPGKLRKAAERRWQRLVIWVGGLGLLLGLGVFVFSLLSSTGAVRPTEAEAVSDTPAGAELKRLEAQIRSRPDAEDIWPALLNLRAQYPNSPESQTASDLLRRVPSPLDKLSADKIPEVERFPWQKDVVAILGEQRWRQWTGAARVLAVSPTGQHLASCGDTDLVYIWDAVTGRPLHFLRTEQYKVHTLAFSPDGKLLASGGEDKSVKLWDTATGSSSGSPLSAHGAAVSSLAFAPDGKTLVTAGHDKKVLLWDMERRKPSTLGDHKGPVLALSFSPDGRTLASGSQDGAVKLWDFEGRKARANLPGHPGGTFTLAFDPRDSGQLASGGNDKLVRIWDTIADIELRSLRGYDKPVTSVAYSPDGKFLAAASNQDHVIRMWSVNARPEVAPAQLKNVAPPQALAFTADSQSLAVGLNWEFTAIRFWDAATAKPLPAAGGPRRAVRAVAITPDCRTLVSLSSDHEPILWDLPGATNRSPAVANPFSCTAMALSPDGQTLASTSSDPKFVQLWDVASGKGRIRFATGHGDNIESLAFAPDGKTLASGGKDRVVRLWDAATGAEKLTLPAAEHTPTFLLFTPDGQTLLVASEALKTVVFWDLAANKERLTIRGLEHGVFAAALSPDGKTLATCGRDNWIRLWDLPSGKEKPGATLRPVAPARGLVFTADGQNVIAAGNDGLINFWRVNGKGTSRAFSLPATVSSLALAPDGRHLAAGAGNGAVYIYRLAPPTVRGE